MYLYLSDVFVIFVFVLVFVKGPSAVSLAEASVFGVLATAKGFSSLPRGRTSDHCCSIFCDKNLYFTKAHPRKSAKADPKSQGCSFYNAKRTCFLQVRQKSRGKNIVLFSFIFEADFSFFSEFGYKLAR